MRNYTYYPRTDLVEHGFLTFPRLYSAYSELALIQRNAQHYCHKNQIAALECF